MRLLFKMQYCIDLFGLWNKDLWALFVEAEAAGKGLSKYTDLTLTPPRSPIQPNRRRLDKESKKTRILIIQSDQLQAFRNKGCYAP